MNYCPICDEESEFVVYNSRPAAVCTHCSSLERHRLVWLYLVEELHLFTGPALTILEVAPNGIIAQPMEAAKNITYHSIDLEYEAKEQMDVQRMTYPAGMFDGVYASHVLEHVEHDILAIREIFRVLKPGGWAILQVPLNNGLTIEHVNGAHTPELRQRVYGQRDHLRFYGRLDYRERLQAQGFAVRVEPYARALGEDVCARYGLQIHEDLYFCRKPPVEMGGGKT